MSGNKFLSEQSVRELTIPFGDLQLAIKVFGELQDEPVIAMHGWQDNAATFDLLAPAIPGICLIAIDFSGHGRSSHRPPGADYYIWSYLEEVLAVVRYFQLTRYSLLGHSMGGAVACLLAALYPDTVLKLVLLDSIGPLPTASSQAPAQMLRALQKKSRQHSDARHYYADLDKAVRARTRTGLSKPAARILAHRSVLEDESGFYWNNDPRLKHPNMLSLTEEHAAAFMSSIQCPVLLVAASQYWGDREAWFAQRIGYFPNLQMVKLDGSHHQHLESKVLEVASLVKDFLSSN